MPRFLTLLLLMAQRAHARCLNAAGPRTIVLGVKLCVRNRDLMPPMTQTNNRIFDELAKLMTDAAGAAQGMRREVETFMKTQGERVLREMDVVTREEFEATKAMAVKARDENEALRARIEALEAELAAMRASA